MNALKPPISIKAAIGRTRAVNAISTPARCCQAAWRESPLISRTNG